MRLSWYDCMKIHLWKEYDLGARNEFKFVNKVLGIKKKHPDALQERYTMVTDEEIQEIEDQIRVREVGDILI